MFSEMMLIILVTALSLQSSSLWSTLIVVPISLILIYSFSSLNMMSGLLMIIYVMVFIGGLLIFLMSVASITPQEQGLSVQTFFLVIILLSMMPFFVYTKKLVTALSWMMLSIWFWGEMTLMLIMGLVLVITLFMVTNFFMVYKGFIRSM